MSPEASQNQTLLSARLSVGYADRPAVLRNLHLDIRRGEVLGLVGQSGSGKSTLALAILGLLDKQKLRTEGAIKFQDSDLLQLPERAMRSLRGLAIGLVLQSPLSSLNPALKIRTQLNEAWRAHASGTSVDCTNAIRTSLQNVSLAADDDFLRKYPSQMSVGPARSISLRNPKFWRCSVN
jgi:peptide/nickel transport system ATP-binding protein